MTRKIAILAAILILSAGCSDPASPDELPQADSISNPDGAEGDMPRRVNGTGTAPGSTSAWSGVGCREAVVSVRSTLFGVRDALPAGYTPASGPIEAIIVVLQACDSFTGPNRTYTNDVTSIFAYALVEPLTNASSDAEAYLFEAATADESLRDALSKLGIDVALEPSATWSQGPDFTAIAQTSLWTYEVSGAIPAPAHSIQPPPIKLLFHHGPADTRQSIMYEATIHGSQNLPGSALVTAQGGIVGRASGPASMALVSTATSTVTWSGSE